MIINSDCDVEYDNTTKHHCTNSNSITGTMISGSQSPTCVPALDDKEIARNCSAQALPNKNCTNLNSITGTKIYGSRSLTCMPVLDDKEVAGNCSAQALLVETVKKRKRQRQYKNTVIDGSSMSTQYRDGSCRIGFFYHRCKHNIKEWHVETIKQTICYNGFHFK